MYGVAVVLPVAVTVSDNVGFVTTITGRSMRPTLNPERSVTDDRVWLSRWRINSYNPAPGDVIAIRSPLDSNTKMVKRVIGTENETLKTRNYKTRYVTVPKGHIWVEGDNERASQDSNFYGPVSKGLVYGKVMFVVWPPHRWGSVPQDTLRYQQERRLKSSKKFFYE